MGLFFSRRKPADASLSSPWPPGTRVSPLSRAEREWLDLLLGTAAKLDLSGSPTAIQAFFDEQRDAWVAEDPAHRGDPDPTIKLIGAAVGQILAERCGLKWSVVEDEYGTELAVTGEAGGVMVFPLNGVAKRWVGENGSSVDEYIDGVQVEVARLRARAR